MFGVDFSTPPCSVLFTLEDTSVSFDVKEKELVHDLLLPCSSLLPNEEKDCKSLSTVNVACPCDCVCDACVLERPCSVLFTLEDA